MDRYLRIHLKRWANREKPPQDGLTRLLWRAAIVRPASLSRIEAFHRWLTAESGRNAAAQVPESFFHQAKVFSLQLSMVSVY